MDCGIQLSGRIVKKMGEVVTILKRTNNLKNLEKWLKYCCLNIRHFKKLLKKCTCVGTKSHLEANIFAMISFREQIKSFLHKGGSYVNRKKVRGMKWEDIESAFKSRLRTSVIVNTSLCCEFVKSIDNENVSSLKCFNTKNVIIDRQTDLKKWFLANVEGPLLAELEEFQERDSGWALREVVHLRIHINKCQLLRGSSYIELPKCIKAKQACVNVQNNDGACFAWAVTSALYPVREHSNRMSSYPHYSTVLKLKGKYSVEPVFLTSKKQAIHVNLLMIQNIYLQDHDDHFDYDSIKHDNDDITIKYHFCWIKNLSRLISRQMSKHDGAIYICDRCQQYFVSEIKLIKHSEECEQYNKCKVVLPAPDKKIMKFKNFANKERTVISVYVDFECILAPIDKCVGKKAKCYQKHIAYSVGYYVCCTYKNELNYYKSYRGENCERWLAMELKTLADKVNETIENPVPMIKLNASEKEKIKMVTNCHICGEPLSATDRVLDHNHFTGAFRGVAHSDCNLNYHESHTIPIVFHNLSGYDAHLIIEEIATAFKGSISLIPLTKENYISFIKQGVFPYDYISDLTKLDEQSLPSIDMFFSTLTDSKISIDEYRHAQNVWKAFNIQTLGEYSDLYLKTDVLLLADIFENFRDMCLEKYLLDPCHYYTLPGLTWQAMLKYTKVELELLTDIDMIMFVEQGTRGGLSQCSNRYAKANNKYMSNYDCNKKSEYLMYWDVNGMYAWAMQQCLPLKNFQWCTDTDIDVKSIPDDNPEGYIFEVDLKYPDDIHDIHNDLPMCPTHEKPPGGKKI
ncbi:uncharacterized protein LOC123295873 [Chrysoperla carnea]|uniref:uncharacterized protein LOC123295873 n=1 Tax=Chrysoperla carnea TaxID=189513 RepID=UPI001D093BC5|nr:uncharacterized protein LOC123295873 [Chrysoperla carnea]